MIENDLLSEKNNFSNKAQ